MTFNYIILMLLFFLLYNSYQCESLNIEYFICVCAVSSDSVIIKNETICGLVQKRHGFYGFRANKTFKHCEEVFAIICQMRPSPHAKASHSMEEEQQFSMSIHIGRLWNPFLMIQKLRSAKIKRRKERGDDETP